jgi:hypothetical protein
MKKLIFITLLTLVSVQNYGQSYHPLPDSNAKWCIEYNNHVIPPPVWWYTNYWEEYYAGDTTILNQEYKKIEKTEYDIFCLNTIINGPDYIGAIRDDTNQKKVFYIPNGATEEKLIYDFNLGIGDTLFSYLNFYQPLIVDFIDSVLISNEYHKRIWFQYDEAEIIEGVGSRTGIVEELIAFEGGSYLCALYVDTTFIFPEHPCNLSSTDTCLTSAVEPKFENSEISIFPNPAKDQLQIKIQRELLSDKPELKIISTNSELCKSRTLTDEITRLDLSDFLPGIYIVQINTENKIILNEKLIIVE